MKFEITIISIISFAIIDVLIWFVLDFLSVDLAKEIAVFIAIIFLSLLIIYFIHGKGILDFDDSSAKKDPRNTRDGLEYKRLKFRKFPYARNSFRKHEYNRKLIWENIAPSFEEYSRKKYL